MTDKNIPYEDQPCGDQSFSNREAINQVLASARIDGYVPDAESAALFEDVATGRKTTEEARAVVLAGVAKRKAERDAKG